MFLSVRVEMFWYLNPFCMQSRKDWQVILSLVAVSVSDFRGYFFGFFLSKEANP